MAKSIFEGFEEFESVQDGTQVIYGVNVLRVDAEVEADPGGMCVSQLVDHYRQVLGLPADVVVFVDGEKFAPSDYIPATARRIELIKPAGRKGACLDQTEKIELDETDACQIAIVHKDTIEYQQDEEVGEISETLLESVTLGAGQFIMGGGDGMVTIGHEVTKATRHEMRTAAKMTRRACWLNVNDVLCGLDEVPVEVRLNGETLDDTYHTLAAGDELVVILLGATREDNFTKWAAWQHQIAIGAHMSAEIERDAAIEARTAELLAMNWAELRILGAQRGVKLSGLGRTADKVRADILMVEFPELPPEDEFVRAWLAENAPETLEA